MTALRLTIVLFAGLGLLAPSSLSQATATTPNPALRTPIDGATDGQYAGGISSFGNIVGISGDQIIVADKGLKTVSILDANTLAFESTDLLSLPGLPTDIDGIVDIAVIAPTDTTPAQAAVLVSRPAPNFESGYSVLVFHRLEVFGTPLWTVNSVDDLNYGAGLATFKLGKLVWSYHHPGLPPRLFVSVTSEFGAHVFAAYDTSATGLAVELFAVPIGGLGPALGTHVAAMASGAGLSSDFNALYRVYIGAYNGLTFESEVMIFDVQVETDALTGVGVLESPYPGVSGFGFALAACRFSLSLAVMSTDRVDLYTSNVGPTLVDHEDTIVSEAAQPGDEFGKALSMSAGGTVLAISETHNDFAGPLNHSGMVRLARRSAAGWRLTGEVYQAHIDPALPNIFFGRDIAMDDVTGSTRLVAGAPVQATIHTFGVASQSWVATDQTFGLAGHAGTRPELDVLAGLYAAPGYVPGPLRISLREARPNASAFLVVGLSVINAPFKQGVLYPSPDLLIAAPTNAEGEIDLALSWSEDAVAAGPFDIPFQWWVQDPDGPKGFASSDGGVLRQD